MNSTQVGAARAASRTKWARLRSRRALRPGSRRRLRGPGTHCLLGDRSPGGTRGNARRPPHLNQVLRESPASPRAPQPVSQPRPARPPTTSTAPHWPRGVARGSRVPIAPNGSSGTGPHGRRRGWRRWPPAVARVRCLQANSAWDPGLHWSPSALQSHLSRLGHSCPRVDARAPAGTPPSFGNPHPRTRWGGVPVSQGLEGPVSRSEEDTGVPPSGGDL